MVWQYLCGQALWRVSIGMYLYQLSGRNDFTSRRCGSHTEKTLNTHTNFFRDVGGWPEGGSGTRCMKHGPNTVKLSKSLRAFLAV